MKKKKVKFLGLLSALALFCTMLSQPAMAANFTDVPGNIWYRSYVYDLVGKGIMQGKGDGRFDPDGKLSRAEMVAIMARSALTEAELRQYEFQGDFKDVTVKHWAYRYINWAAEAGVVNGCGDGTFQPNRPVSRQDMAVMLVNFSRATGRQITPTRPPVNFTDGGSIAKYAAASVSACQQAGVITGSDSGAFMPKDTASRAQAATMYSRFLANCVVKDYKITKKRVFTTPVRAVEFSGDTYSPQLVMGHDRVTGGEAPGSVVERTGAKVAVNAAFFDMDSYLPLGTLIQDGQVLTVWDRFAPARSALVKDSTGRLSIQNFSTTHTITLQKEDGSESVLQGVTVNRKPATATDGTRILFTRKWGRTLGFPAKDAVVLDDEGVILAIYHDVDVDIPETGYVLAQRSRRTYEGDFFDSCAVGMTVDIEREYEGAQTQDIVMSIGAGPRLVKDGQVYGGLETYRAEGFSDPTISTYSALRVCLGLKADGSIVIVSAYATLPQMSKIMVSFGCRDAINFDGGGSTNLYVDGQWLRGPQDRPLNSILIFK